MDNFNCGSKYEVACIHITKFIISTIHIFLCSHNELKTQIKKGHRFRFIAERQQRYTIIYRERTEASFKANNFFLAW